MAWAVFSRREEISRASANQRSGRCGRLGPGIAIRLYSEEDYAGRPEFTEPEILRTSLASVIDKLEEDHEYLTAGGVFTEDLIETYVKLKYDNEITPVRLRPTPQEFEMYFDC